MDTWILEGTGLLGEILFATAGTEGLTRGSYQYRDGTKACGFKSLDGSEWSSSSRDGVLVSYCVPCSV